MQTNIPVTRPAPQGSAQRVKQPMTMTFGKQGVEGSPAPTKDQLTDVRKRFADYQKMFQMDQSDSRYDFSPLGLSQSRQLLEQQSILKTDKSIDFSMSTTYRKPADHQQQSKPLQKNNPSGIKGSIYRSLVQSSIDKGEPQASGHSPSVKQSNPSFKVNRDQLNEFSRQFVSRKEPFMPGDITSSSIFAEINNKNKLTGPKKKTKPKKKKKDKSEIQIALNESSSSIDREADQPNNVDENSVLSIRETHRTAQEEEDTRAQRCVMVDEAYAKAARDKNDFSSPPLNQTFSVMENPLPQNTGRHLTTAEEQHEDNTNDMLDLRLSNAENVSHNLLHLKGSWQTSMMQSQHVTGHRSSTTHGEEPKERPAGFSSSANIPGGLHFKSSNSLSPRAIDSEKRLLGSHDNASSFQEIYLKHNFKTSRQRDSKLNSQKIEHQRSMSHQQQETEKQKEEAHRKKMLQFNSQGSEQSKRPFVLSMKPIPEQQHPTSKKDGGSSCFSMNIKSITAPTPQQIDDQIIYSNNDVGEEDPIEANYQMRHSAAGGDLGLLSILQPDQASISTQQIIQQSKMRPATQQSKDAGLGKPEWNPFTAKNIPKLHISLLQKQTDQDPSLVTNTTQRMNNQENFESYVQDLADRQESYQGVITGVNSVGFQTKREDSTDFLNRPGIGSRGSSLGQITRNNTTHHNANTVCPKSTTMRDNSSIAATSVALVSNNRINEMQMSFSQVKEPIHLDDEDDDDEDNPIQTLLSDEHSSLIHDDQLEDEGKEQALSAMKTNRQKAEENIVRVAEDKGNGTQYVQILLTEDFNQLPPEILRNIQVIDKNKIVVPIRHLNQSGTNKLSFVSGSASTGCAEAGMNDLPSQIHRSTMGSPEMSIVVKGNNLPMNLSIQEEVKEESKVGDAIYPVIELPREEEGLKDTQKDSSKAGSNFLSSEKTANFKDFNKLLFPRTGYEFSKQSSSEIDNPGLLPFPTKTLSDTLNDIIVPKQRETKKSGESSSGRNAAHNSNRLKDTSTLSKMMISNTSSVNDFKISDAAPLESGAAESQKNSLHKIEELIDDSQSRLNLVSNRPSDDVVKEVKKTTSRNDRAPQQNTESDLNELIRFSLDDPQPSGNPSMVVPVFDDRVDPPFELARIPEIGNGRSEDKTSQISKSYKPQGTSASKIIRDGHPHCESSSNFSKLSLHSLISSAKLKGIIGGNEPSEYGGLRDRPDSGLKYPLHPDEERKTASRQIISSSAEVANPVIASPYGAPKVLEVENQDTSEWNKAMHRTTGLVTFKQPEQYKEELKNKLDEDLTTPSMSRILVSGGNASRPLGSTIIMQGSVREKEGRQMVVASLQKEINFKEEETGIRLDSDEVNFRHFLDDKIKGVGTLNEESKQPDLQGLEDEPRHLLDLHPNAAEQAGEEDAQGNHYVAGSPSHGEGQNQGVYSQSEEQKENEDPLSCSDLNDSQDSLPPSEFSETQKQIRKALYDRGPVEDIEDLNELESGSFSSFSDDIGQEKSNIDAESPSLTNQQVEREVGSPVDYYQLSSPPKLLAPAPAVQPKDLYYNKSLFPTLPKKTLSNCHSRECSQDSRSFRRRGNNSNYSGSSCHNCSIEKDKSKVTMEAYQTLVDINMKLLRHIDSLNSKLESSASLASSMPFTDHKRERSVPQKKRSEQEFSDLYFPSPAMKNQTLLQDYYSGSKRKNAKVNQTLTKPKETSFSSLFSQQKEFLKQLYRERFNFKPDQHQHRAAHHRQGTTFLNSTKSLENELNGGCCGLGSSKGGLPVRYRSSDKSYEQQPSYETRPYFEVKRLQQSKPKYNCHSLSSSKGYSGNY